MKTMILTYFHKSSQINPEAFQDQKNSILTQKAMIFKQKDCGIEVWGVYSGIPGCECEGC